MESLVKELLENVVGRLSKIETQQEAQLMRESQIDQVIERLDTIQNRQTQFQHKLSDFSTQQKQERAFMRDQLSTISTQQKQERAFMRDQLKEAQDEILHRLSELQQQNVSTRSQAVSVGEEMKQLQATAGSNPVKETSEFCSQADGDVMDARLAKMSETLEQSVKAVTRAELVWLDNQTDQRISELRDKVGELTEETLKIADSIKKENKDLATDFKIDVGEEIRAENELIIQFLTETADKNRESISQQREDMKTFYTELVTQVKKTSAELSRTLDQVKKGINDHMQTVKQEIIADINTANMKAQNQVLSNVLGQTEAKVKESTEKVTGELGKVKEELLKNTNSVCKTLKDEVIKLHKETIEKIETTDKQQQGADPNMHTKFESTVKESMDKVLTDLDKTKRQLVCLVEGQNYKTSRLLAHPGLYVFDFYIENFKQLANGTKVRSEDWFIKQFCTSVHGYVDFPSYYTKMRIYLAHSKYHSDLGLQLKSGVTLRIKVTITDTSGQLPDVLVGQHRHTWEEKAINKGEYWAKFIGETQCIDLIQRGYLKKDGYMNGAVLLRYEIEVL